MTHFNLFNVRGGFFVQKDVKVGATGYFASSISELEQKVLAGGPVSKLLAIVPTLNDRRFITDTDRFAFFYPAVDPVAPSLLTEDEMVDMVGDFIYDEDTQLPSLVVDAKYFTLEDGTEELAILVGGDWMTAKDLAEGPYDLKEKEESLGEMFERWLESDDAPLTEELEEALRAAISMDEEKENWIFEIKIGD